MSAKDRPVTVWDISLHKRLQQGPQRFTLDVHFVADVQRVVLFGPSGAGKTQTLRMVAGITRPDAGHVRLAGQTLYDRDAGVDLPAPRRRIGYVFQDYALFPHLTVRQNIGFALKRGWRNPGREPGEHQVERWLEQLQLSAVAGHYPHQISGGQRQRTALARALVTQPAALLLDEPFAALDKPLRERLREELLQLQRSLALPLLLITHDDDDVRHLAQAVVPMDDGRVVAAPNPAGTDPRHRPGGAHRGVT
jgi:molybdate transport system ATP-binding protein